MVAVSPQTLAATYSIDFESTSTRNAAKTAVSSAGGFSNQQSGPSGSVTVDNSEALFHWNMVRGLSSGDANLPEAGSVDLLG